MRKRLFGSSLFSPICVTKDVVLGTPAMKSVGILLAAVALLSGCETGAQRQAAVYQQVSNSYSEAMETCLNQLLQNSDNAAAAALFPLDNPSSISIDQLSNTSRPTATDMRRIIAFKQGVDQCWANNGLNLRSTDPVLSSIIETNLRETNLIIADMARGKLNLGDANRRMQSEETQGNAKAEAHMRQIEADLLAQHRAELAERQAERERMKEWMKPKR
jgi:uncharacterized protein YceK